MRKLFNKKTAGKLILFLPAVFVVFSCNDPITLGEEVVPDGDAPGVYFTDTITLVSSTVKEDSVPSGKNFNVNTFLAGSYTDQDPNSGFGFVSAGFSTQFEITTNNPNFGTNPVLDSVILSLTYKSFYGPDTNSQKLYVFQLKERLNADSSYYSNRTPGYSTPAPTLLNTPTDFTVHLKDSVHTDGDTLAPHLRIPLNVTNFGWALTGGNYSSNDAFHDHFEGIYVTGDTLATVGANANGIISFDYSNSQTKITLYYHNDTDTSTYNYVINSSCANYNRFIHDFAFSNPPAIFNNHYGEEKPFGEDKIYVQAMSGVKAKINFPYVESFKSLGKIAINKAEIITKAIVQPGGLSPAPKLVILAVDSDGKGTALPDFFDQNVYGGSISNNEYHINITKHFQNLVNGTRTNYGLYLASPTDALYNTTTNASNTAYQTVIGGSANAGNKLRLLITYTKLNN